jgi:hypothetical protein
VTRIVAVVCGALLLVAAATAHAADPPRASGQTMVLIVSRDSPVTHLDVIDVRKLFLGLTVTSNGHSLRPLDNRSDDKLHQAFLQNVLAMPERAYERRLLSMTLQQGTHRPEAFETASALIGAVGKDPSAVSIAWASDVAQDSHIRVLRVLWRD